MHTKNKINVSILGKFIINTQQQNVIARKKPYQIIEEIIFQT